MNVIALFLPRKSLFSDCLNMPCMIRSDKVYSKSKASNQ